MRQSVARLQKSEYAEGPNAHLRRFGFVSFKSSSSALAVAWQYAGPALRSFAISSGTRAAHEGVRQIRNVDHTIYSNAVADSDLLAFSAFVPVLKNSTSLLPRSIAAAA